MPKTWQKLGRAKIKKRGKITTALGVYTSVSSLTKGVLLRTTLKPHANPLCEPAKKRGVVKGFTRKPLKENVPSAAFPVDLLRGDYGSAALDLFGAIPFVGEVADTARLAKTGVNIADALKDTDNIIDAAKAVENVDDIYTARKVDGTIKAFLDASDDPVSELTKMSDSIAKTAPVKIPEGAAIKTKVANKGYYHMEYNWIADDGYEYITRWHTRNPTAPLEQRDVWVIERKIKGIGAGPNHRQGLHQVCVGKNEWITHDEWRQAAKANQLGIATEQQKEWLKNGHYKA